MRKMFAAAIVAALLISACSAPVDDSPVLEEGIYTATLRVRNTWDWDSAVWEKDRGYNVYFDVVESSEAIDGANITVWPDETELSVAFRDSSLPVIAESGDIGVTELVPLNIDLPDTARQQLFALNVGDTITIQYNKVVPPAEVAKVTSKPAISVDDYHGDNDTYKELDRAIMWRGKHSRVNVVVDLRPDK